MSASVDAQVLTLVERLVRAGDLDEACSVLLERTVGARGIRRGLIVIGMERGLRAFGWGISRPELAAFLDDSRAAEARIYAATYRRDPVVAVPPDYVEPLELSPCVMLPFDPGQGADVGALIVEAELEEPRVAEIGAVVRRCAPILGLRFSAEDRTGALARSDRHRALLTTVINALWDPILLTDAENAILLSNDRAEHLFTAAPDDSEGRRRAVQINNLLFSSFRTQVVIGSRDASSRELNLVDPSDGSDLLFEVLTAPLPPTGPGGGGAISILRDITDLKRAVAELEVQFNRSRVAEHHARKERDRLNAILENVGGPILVTDNHSNIILMNPDAEQLLDVRASADRGAVAHRFVQANDTRFTTLMSDFLLQDALRRVEQLELTDPGTGSEFTVEVISTKIVDAHGEPTAVVSVLHDLTQAVENERLARELQQLNDELEDRIRRATEELEEHNRRLEWQSRELSKASRLKSEFLASMSHELRTPLNVVLGYTSLMTDRIYGDLTEWQAQALEKVQTASRHLLELINDILDLSKIEAGQMPVHLEPVRLEDVLGEVQQVIEPLLTRKPIEYDLDVAPDLPMLVTDRTKLKQILFNLVSNAVKFTEHGSVRITACPLAGGERVQISVADTGVGIRPEHIETIFQDFRQVDQSPTREHGGTGLGLSITKRLLALLGGEITVQSEYGAGSTFLVDLPVSSAGVRGVAARPIESVVPVGQADATGGG